MVTNYSEFDDIVAFHPGFLIQDEMTALNMNQSEFALRLGTTPKTLSLLVNGQIRLSDDLAMKLSLMLGTSVDVWLNLQKKYDERLIEIERQKQIIRDTSRIAAFRP